MVKVSIKNWKAIVLFFAPSAFLTPISRVLSVTETTIIFIKAIDEPRIVIIPITHAEMLNTSVILAILLIKSSLLEMAKLFSSTGFSFLTFRIVFKALSTASSNSSDFSIIVLKE